MTPYKQALDDSEEEKLTFNRTKPLRALLPILPQKQHKPAVWELSALLGRCGTWRPLRYGVSLYVNGLRTQTNEDKDLASHQTSFLNNENKQLNKVETSKLILILMVQVPSTFNSCISQNTKSEICNHKLQDHS